MGTSVRCLGALLALAASLTACQYITDPSPEITTASAPVSPEPERTVTAEPEEPPAATELPGEPVGLPAEGTPLVVVGVPAQERLNLRIGPGTDYDSVARIEPMRPDLIATGENRLVEEHEWYRVDTGVQRGWLRSDYLAQVGATIDATDRFTGVQGSTDPRELAATLVATWDATPGETRYAIVDGPTRVGDLQMRIDVFDGDGAVIGFRLFVVAAREDEDAPWTPLRATATQLCRELRPDARECA